AGGFVWKFGTSGTGGGVGCDRVALGFVLHFSCGWRGLAWFGRVWRALAHGACLPSPVTVAGEGASWAARAGIAPGARVSVGSFCAGGWDGVVWRALARFGVVWRAVRVARRCCQSTDWTVARRRAAAVGR